MSETTIRVAKRDMAPSGIAKILEIFFGGNTAVDAAVVYDETGETVDYHTVLDPFETKLAAAYCGILFESTRYRFNWLERAALQSLEFRTEQYDFLTVPLGEGFFLTLIIRPGALDEALEDTVTGAVEALYAEIA